MELRPSTERESSAVVSWRRARNGRWCRSVVSAVWSSRTNRGVSGLLDLATERQRSSGGFLVDEVYARNRGVGDGGQ